MASAPWRVAMTIGYERALDFLQPPTGTSAADIGLIR